MSDCLHVSLRLNICYIKQEAKFVSIYRNKLIWRWNYLLKETVIINYTGNVNITFQTTLFIYILVVYCNILLNRPWVVKAFMIFPSAWIAIYERSLCILVRQNRCYVRSDFYYIFYIWHARGEYSGHSARMSVFMSQWRQRRFDLLPFCLHAGQRQHQKHTPSISLFFFFSRC